MSNDPLERVFGPDPDPRGPLPSLVTSGPSVDHPHRWSYREAAGIRYRECGLCSAIQCLWEDADE